MKYQLLVLLSVLSLVSNIPVSADIIEGKIKVAKETEAEKKYQSVVEIEYDKGGRYKFNQEEKDLVKQVISLAEMSVRAQLPELDTKIRIVVTSIDREINQVGGVTGRADAVGEVVIMISTKYPGGVIEAIKAGLSGTVHHEFHHLVRGWTMNGNQFDKGIPIAAVNEGLAVVFSEKYSGVVEEGNAYPKNVDSWVNEILDLPKYADYGEWMMLHPDGRESIGYKSGKYIVERAMKNSAMDILELSKVTPYEILKLSGVINNHAPSFHKLAEFYEGKVQQEKAITAYQQAFKISQKNKNDDGSKYLARIELIKHPVKLSEDALTQLTGQYKNGKYNFTITSNGIRLIANNEGWPQLQLIAESKSKFFIRGENITFEFSNTADKPFDLLTLVRGKKTIEMNKIN
jgi:uncharacterized protein YjaZ